MSENETCGPRAPILAADSGHGRLSVHLPSPFPRDLPPLWREGRTAFELAGLLRSALYREADPQAGGGRPVLLIPGFLAGDDTLSLLARWLRRAGYDAFGAGMRANVGCAREALDDLEAKLQERGDGPVAIVGHSHGGTLGRSLAMRRPDLVSGVVAMGSPLVDHLAIHPVARGTVRMVGRLGSLGTRGLFRRECLAGECCREIHEARTRPFPEDVGFVTVFSRGDGVVAWQACLDPRARAVEVSATHLGMAVNAGAYRAVGEALRSFAAAPAPAAAPVTR